MLTVTNDVKIFAQVLETYRRIARSCFCFFLFLFFFTLKMNPISFFT